MVHISHRQKHTQKELQSNLADLSQSGKSEQYPSSNGWRLSNDTVGKNSNLHRTRGSGIGADGKVFIEQGWIDEETEPAFDTLIEKICEPAPWDYDPKEVV